VTIGSVLFAFIAGVLSILSPCVLPILPIALGAAASEHKWGPVALATGLALSFVVIGLFVATVGYSIGLNEDLFRYAAATLVVIFGALLVLPGLQARFAMASGPIANWTDRRFGTTHGNGFSGQFWIGALLGAVWSPCVGPTLGAASLLAAQGRDLAQVALTMFAFGVGAVLPLLTLGMFSRELLLRWRKQMISAGYGAKMTLGLLFIAIGALVLSGFDKTVETALVNASPRWLTDLTTSL
jgi:cytochrome c-type biogenesis protein